MSEYVPITIHSLNEDAGIAEIEKALPVTNQAVWFKAKVLDHLKMITPDAANVVSMVQLSNGAFFFVPRNMRYYDIKTVTYKSEVVAETIGLIASLMAFSDLIDLLDKQKRNIEPLIELYFKLRNYAVIDYRYSHEVSFVIDAPEILAAKICG